MLAVLGCGLGCGRRQALPRAQKGVLDLSRLDLGQIPALSLKGEWDFHAGKLLTPTDLPGIRPDAQPSVPAGLHQMAAPASKGRSFGTLHLKVLLPKDRPTLGLKVPPIFSAYRLWINGAEASRCGQVGMEAAGERMEVETRHLLLPAGVDTLDLVVQVSNHHFRDGGLETPLELDRYERLLAAQHRKDILVWLVIGALLIMGLYHLALYAFRPADPAPLWFGIYVLLWMGNTLFTGGCDYPIRVFLDQLHTVELYRAFAACMILSSSFSVLFLRSLYPEEFPRWLVPVCILVSLGFTLVMLSAPLLWASRTLGMYYLYATVKVTFTVVLLAIAWRRRRVGAAYILAGFILMWLTGTNDILNDLGLIDTAYLVHVGTLCFLMAQALAVCLRFSRAFTSVERLSGELGSKNQALETEMARRSQLEQEIVAVSEEERRSISQELHDGLCQQLTGARLQCSILQGIHPEGPARQALSRLSGLLSDSVGHAYDLSHGLWPIEQAPEQIQKALEELAAKVSETGGISIAFSAALPCVRCTHPHARHLYHIARESLTNVVKHAQAAEVRMTLACQGEAISLSVEDDGRGLKPGQKSRGGLGTRMMAHRTSSAGGSYRLEDRVEGGCRSICTLPCSVPAVVPEEG